MKGGQGLGDGRPIKKFKIIEDLIESGRGTRLGPSWPGQRCHAKTRKGTPCQNPVVTGRNRCRMHGGKSTGPRTAEGKARVAEALGHFLWKNGSGANLVPK